MNGKRIALVVSGALAACLQSASWHRRHSLSWATRRRTATATCRPTPTSSRPERVHSRPRTSTWISATATGSLDTNDLGKVEAPGRVSRREAGVRRHRPHERRGGLPRRVLAHHAHGRRHLAVRGELRRPRRQRRPAAPADSQHLGRIRAGLGQADPELGDRGRRLVGRGDERRRLRRSRRRHQQPGEPRSALGWTALGSGGFVPPSERPPVRRIRPPAATRRNRAGRPSLGSCAAYGRTEARPTRPRPCRAAFDALCGDVRDALTPTWPW